MRIARDAGKYKGKVVAPRFSCGLPLMQCVLIKSFPVATDNESEVEMLLKNIALR